MRDSSTVFTGDRGYNPSLHVQRKREKRGWEDHPLKQGGADHPGPRQGRLTGSRQETRMVLTSSTQVPCPQTQQPPRCGVHASTH